MNFLTKPDFSLKTDSGIEIPCYKKSIKDNKGNGLTVHVGTTGFNDKSEHEETITVFAIKEIGAEDMSAMMITDDGNRISNTIQKVGIGLYGKDEFVAFYKALEFAVEKLKPYYKKEKNPPSCSAENNDQISYTNIAENVGKY